MERKWNYKEIINGKEGWNEKMVKKKDGTKRKQGSVYWFKCNYINEYIKWKWTKHLN